MFLRQALLAHK